MFGHSGAFPVPPLHLMNHVIDPSKVPARRTATLKVTAAPSTPTPSPADIRKQRSRARTLPPFPGEESAIKSFRASHTLPKAASSYMTGDHLLEILQSLTEQCNAEELRVQTLEGTIRHKISEFPTVISRLDELDQKAIDLYESLMDSQAIPLDTSPSFRPFDRPTPSVNDTESDTDSLIQNRAGESSRTSTVRPSAPALLDHFTTRLEKAEEEVNTSKATMLERQQKLRNAAAVLGRDADIIAEIERRISRIKKDIELFAARRRMQNIAMLVAGVLVAIAGVLLAIWFSLWQTDEISPKE